MQHLRISNFSDRPSELYHSLISREKRKPNSKRLFIMKSNTDLIFGATPERSSKTLMGSRAPVQVFRRSDDIYYPQQMLNLFPYVHVPNEHHPYNMSSIRPNNNIAQISQKYEEGYLHTDFTAIYFATSPIVFLACVSPSGLEISRS